jgi:putative peptidoglycan lipid II flippase
MMVAAPGLSGADRELAIFLFRLMLPMLVLHCLLAVVKGALNSIDHYAMPEYAGVFFNLVMILCALLLTGSFGVTSLAIGVIGGSLMQLLVQIPVLAQKGIRYQPRLGFSHPALREMRGLVIGALVSTAVVPVNAFIARAMASSLPEGSISALAYAFRIFILPVSLFAVPVYTVLLTDLSTAQQQGARDRFREQAAAGLSLLFAVALPATAVVIALATPITRLLYERGQFTAEDTLMTSQALMAYGVGVLAYGTSQIMVRLFNATKDTSTPAWVGAGSVAVSVVGNWLLMQIWGHWGIALVTSLVSYVNTIVLYLIFRRRHGPLDETLLLRRFVTHCCLATGLGIVLFFLGRSLAVVQGSLLLPLYLLQFAGVLLAGGIAYLGLAYVFKVEEVLAMGRLVAKRFRRA